MSQDFIARAARHRIFLIRHCESYEDVDNSVYDRLPDVEIGLTQEGERQAVQVGRYLEGIGLKSPFAIFHSPGARNRQTSTIIAQTLLCPTCEINESPLLRKQNWGTFSLQNRRQIEKDRYRIGVFFYRFLGGESGGDVYNRITRFVACLESEFEKDRLPPILIVTHGLELRLLLMSLFRWSIEEFEGLAGPPNGYCVAIKQNGHAEYTLEQPYPSYKGRISREGRTPHPLDGQDRIQ